MKFINASQEPEHEEKETGSNRLAERRMTISALSKDKNKTAHGETINLEKQFKVRFQGLIYFKVCLISTGIVCRGGRGPDDDEPPEHPEGHHGPHPEAGLHLRH